MILTFSYDRPGDPSPGARLRQVQVNLTRHADDILSAQVTLEALQHVVALINAGQMTNVLASISDVGVP